MGGWWKDIHYYELQMIHNCEEKLSWYPEWNKYKDGGNETKYSGSFLQNMTKNIMKIIFVFYFIRGF